jgi:hypothetical protein
VSGRVRPAHRCRAHELFPNDEEKRPLGHGRSLTRLRRVTTLRMPVVAMLLLRGWMYERFKRRPP